MLLQEERWTSGGYDWNGGTFGFHHNKVYCSYKGAVTRSAIIRNDWKVVCTFGDKWLLCAGSRNDLYVVRTGTR